MRTSCLSLVVSALLTIGITGCGGGAATDTTPQAASTNIAITFTDGPPIKVATQEGSGALTSASLTNGVLNLALPSSTTKYTVVYLCPGIFVFPDEIEYILEATPADGTAFTVSCFVQQPFGNLNSGSVQVDASAFPGTFGVAFYGLNGLAGGESLGSGFVSDVVDYHLPSGTYDVAVAIGGCCGITALRMLRAQTIPGSLNGGNPIVFTQSDAATSGPQTVSDINIPAGFSVSPVSDITYRTSTGTIINLNANGAMQYSSVPPTVTVPTDFYRYDRNYFDTQGQGVGAVATSSSFITSISLPQPWTYSGPAPAAFPTFTFDYSGFPPVAQYAELLWPCCILHEPHTAITVLATANFQNGATTITIPDVTGLQGFIAPPPSGTPVFWGADVFGGTHTPFQVFPTVPPPSAIPPPRVPVVPPDSSLQFVHTEGSFVQP